MNARAAWLAEWADSLARNDALVDAVARDGALSRAMSSWALSAALSAFHYDALEGAPVDPAHSNARVSVRLAASVPTAPLRAIALPVLAGAREVTVRPSRHQSAVVDEIARTWGGPCPLYVSHADLFDAVDAVLAYGSDETIASLDARIPTHVRFTGYGHGFGVVVNAEPSAVGDAGSLANDVAMYDQRGCLSPQCIFADAHFAWELADRLHTELARRTTTLPRGPLDAGFASRIAQWQGSTAAVADRFWRGDDHAVALMSSCALASSPGGRQIAVVPFDSIEQVRAVLAPVAHHLTQIGVDGWPAEKAAPSGFRGRFAHRGTMQCPPFDGPDDPRPPLVRR